MINYLGYKFLLFCKVSTQPRRSSARWVCSRETEQPSPQQTLPRAGAREGEGTSSRVGSDWPVAWAEDKDPWKGAKEGRGTGAAECQVSVGAAPGSHWGGVAFLVSFQQLLSPGWAALATTAHLPGQPPHAALTAGPGAAGTEAHGTSTSSSVKWRQCGICPVPGSEGSAWSRMSLA